MAKSVATVWVPVDDMDRAKRFYGETLRLQVTKETPEWSEVDAGNLTIGLNAREETARHAEGGAVITFTPEGGIDAEVGRLEGEGITFRAASATTRGAGSRRSATPRATTCSCTPRRRTEPRRARRTGPAGPGRARVPSDVPAAVEGAV